MTNVHYSRHCLKFQSIVHSFLLICRTYVFPRFLNPERAEHFVKLAKARLAPSSLAFKKGDTADTTKYALFLSH